MKGPRTFADIEALEAIPLEQRQFASSTFAMLLEGAAINPDALAFRYFFDGERYEHAIDYTFSQVAEKLHQTANLFKELNLEPTEVISCLLPNIPEMAFAFWGGQAVGIVNPINPLLEADQIADIMRAAGTKILVCLGPFPKTDIWQKVTQIKDTIPTLKTIVTIDLNQYLPVGKRLAVIALQWFQPKAESENHQLIDFNQTLRSQPADYLLRPRQIQADNIACYFHTGGTTGTPKLAPLTHGNLTSETWIASQLIQAEPSDGPMVFFCGLPWFHVNGVIVTGSIPWSQGYTLVMGSPQGYRGAGVLKNFWKLVDHYQITAFSGVPTIFSYLLDVPIGRNNIRSLRYALCGAAPMPVEVIRAFEERTGLSIAEGYGFTEGTCISTCNPITGERIKGSIGLRLPYQAIKPVILDEQTGAYVRDAAINEIGVLAARGSNIFKGYLQSEHNHGIWINTGDGEGPFYNTGDLGRMDERGYYYITGRRKELIIRGGHNIDPKLIEDALAQHPTVALVAAVGSPDARLGEIPVAYVTLAAGKRISEAELLAFAQTRITERAAVPRRIYIKTALPLTAIGKLFKPALVKEEISRVFSHEIAKIQTIKLQAITIRDDKKQGFIAHLKCLSSDRQLAQQQLKTVLGEFVYAYEVDWN